MLRGRAPVRIGGMPWECSASGMTGCVNSFSSFCSLSVHVGEYFTVFALGLTGNPSTSFLIAHLLLDTLGSAVRSWVEDEA
jgi:hypothetical protein